jgi:hypothetical protein
MERGLRVGLPGCPTSHGCQISSGPVFMIHTPALRKSLYAWIIVVIVKQRLVQTCRVNGPIDYSSLILAAIKSATQNMIQTPYSTVLSPSLRRFRARGKHVAQRRRAWFRSGESIAAIIYDEYSVGSSMRPICTRLCFVMTIIIQACSNFH